MAKKNKKSLIAEFKEFAFKGNVVDMAVGVVIGGAFGSIVSSLVNDIIMPLVSLLTGGKDFTQLFVQLGGDTKYETITEAKEAGQAVLAYGNFIQFILNFFIIAICVFLVVKLLRRGKEKKAAAEAAAAEAEAAKKAAEEAEAAANAPKEPTEKELLAEIVELLKNK